MPVNYWFYDRTWGHFLNGTPFVVGATGHRDIEPKDFDEAIASIHAFLQELQGRLPDTPLLLLTGLADGADRLAAQCALDKGIRVHAVLPMAQADYEDDFTESSREEFRQLLAADGVSTTELVSVSTGGQVDRNACYRQLTECLLRKSNLLLALWDGSEQRKTGGTADTLLSFLAKSDDSAQSLQLVAEAPVRSTGNDYAYWVPVSRKNSEKVESNDGRYLVGIEATPVVVAVENMPEPLSLQLDEFNSYNAEISAIKDDKRPSWGLPDISDEFRQDELLTEIEDEFERADGLAVHYQSKSDSLFKAFSLMACALGFLFLTYAKLLASNVFLYGYMALFVAGFVIFRVAANRHWFAKHIMYRVIAETLRIKFFLRLAKADHLVDVSAIAHQAGIDKFTGFSWISHVFKSAEPVVANKPAAQDAESVDEARRLWVADQSSYFAKKIHVMHHAHHRVERIKQFLLGATAVGIVVLILFKYPLMNHIPGTELQYKKLLVFFMGLFPFLLGVWELYHNKMATKELLWQYRNQADAFALTEFQMNHDESPAHQRKVLASLASNALFENYLWTIHRFHREHEPPAAG